MSSARRSTSYPARLHLRYAGPVSSTSSARTIAIHASLALLVAACDGEGLRDAGVDAGPGEDAATADAGADAGQQADAGPAPTFVARLVNNIPGHAAVDVCMWTSVGGTIVPADTPGVLLTAGDVVVPFRGVSSYIEDNPFFIAYDVVDFRVALYPAEGFSGTCPDDPSAAGAPDAALIGTILGADLEADGRYTILAAGFDEGTLGAAEGELPSRCGVTLDQPCDETTAARLFLVRDDLGAPGDGRAKLRISSQVPNVAPAGFNVCYDADLVPSTTERGVCSEPDPTTDPVVLAANVTYGSVTEYAEVDPIQPTSALALGVGGGIYLVLETTGSTGCPPFSELSAPAQRCYPILAAFPPPPPPSENIRPHVAAGDVSTLFIAGAAGLSGAEAPYAASMLLWQDNFAAAP